VYEHCVVLSVTEHTDPSYSVEASSSLADQDVLRILWNLKVYYLGHKWPVSLSRTSQSTSPILRILEHFKYFSKYARYSIYLSVLVTAVAVFRNPNTIPFSLATDLLNVLFSWLLVHLPSTFFLDVLFFFARSSECFNPYKQ